MPPGSQCSAISEANNLPMLKSLLPYTSAFIPLSCPFPTDHIPPSANIFRPHVIVLQVVGMLPNIQIQDWPLAPRQRRCLVCGGNDVQTPATVHQPCITGTKYLQRRFGKLFLKVLHTSKLPDQSTRQSAFRLLSPAGCIPSKKNWWLYTPPALREMGIRFVAGSSGALIMSCSKARHCRPGQFSSA